MVAARLRHGTHQAFVVIGHAVRAAHGLVLLGAGLVADGDLLALAGGRAEL